MKLHAALFLSTLLAALSGNALAVDPLDSPLQIPGSNGGYTTDSSVFATDYDTASTLVMYTADKSTSFTITTTPSGIVIDGVPWPFPAFSTVDTPAGTDPVATVYNDTLRFAAASGMVITGDSTTNTVTFDAVVDGFANPTATVNGTATNGAATTAMRSDAAPALADPLTPADGTQNVTGSLTASDVLTGTTRVDAPVLRATTSAGVQLQTASGTATGTFGAGGGANASLPGTTVTGTINVSSYIQQGSNDVINVITGTENEFYGRSGNRTTTGVRNTAGGRVALDAVTTGDQNTAFGFDALGAMATGNGNSAFGENALDDATGTTDNTAIGSLALSNASLSGSFNTFVGAQAGTALTSGGSNVAVGRLAMSGNQTGSNNVAIGANTITAATAPVTSFAIGTSAFQNTTTLNNSVAIGNQAGQNDSSVTQSVLIGNLARVGGGTGTRRVVIGYDAAGTADNQITLGTSIYETHIPGTLRVTNDAEFNSQVFAPSLGSDLQGQVLGLNPSGQIVGLGSLSTDSSGNLTVFDANLSAFDITALNDLSVNGTFNALGLVSITPTVMLGRNSGNVVGTVSSVPDSLITDALTINGGTINNTPIGATTASTLRGTTLALTGQPTCGAFHNTTQSINNITSTAVLFNSETWDVGGIHDTVSNTDRFTIPTGQGGYYLVTGYVNFASNATGDRQVWIENSGEASVRYGFTAVSANGSDATRLDFAATVSTSAGNIIRVYARQSSGGALNISSTNSVEMNRIQISKLY